MNEQTERRAFIETSCKSFDWSVDIGDRSCYLKEIKLAAQGEQLYRKVKVSYQDADTSLSDRDGRKFYMNDKEIFELDPVTVPATIASDENEQLLNALNEARAAESIALNKAQYCIDALADANEKIEKLTRECADWESKFTAEQRTLRTIIKRGAELERELKAL